VLVALVSLRLRHLLLALLVAAISASQIDLTYYAERLDLSEESQNLSSLVYQQGWQLVSESWDKSDGWGLGFQQLGIEGTNVDVAVQIEKIARVPLNLLDGGFTASKLLSEFGVLGAALLFGYFRIAKRSVIALRGSSDRPGTIFAHCAMVSYSLELGLRGAGYFTPGVVLTVAALWLLAADRRSRRPGLSLALAPHERA
jgi:hypothetical protein